AYLHPVMQRSNLTVITRAHATGIVLAGKRATGIRYRTRKGEAVAQASREVILCGGAFGSPQLLLLSGIGPAAELAVHGVPVVHELPGVGKNLQDHLDFIVGWRSKDTDMLGMSPRGAWGFLRHIAQWRRDGTGLIASPSAESGAFVKSDPALERPDLQLQFVIGLVENHARTLHYGFGFSCHVCILRPHSRGEVGLASADPLAAPRIDPRFLGDQRDAELLLKGVRITRQVLASPALTRYRHKEMHIAGEPSDADLMTHIRTRADTVYHPVGSCRMGSTRWRWSIRNSRCAGLKPCVSWTPR
ncbi:GMC family oxidoreductase N-terminal domain-containing protein, partial [Mesorhizobium sp. M7A.F.Ca.CA.004.06.1.1]